MSYYIFFLFLFIFCFSREDCSARCLSSSNPLHHSPFKEQDPAALQKGLLFQVRNKREISLTQDSNRSAVDAHFQHSVASPTTAPPAQDEDQLHEEKENGGVQNKNATGSVSTSTDTDSIQPSFDYSDYSRPRTRPPSHN